MDHVVTFAKTPPPALALVSMPWSLMGRPSLQLATLKSSLRQELPGLDIACLHPYLRLGRALGPKVYHEIAQRHWVGEAVFASLVFPENADAARSLAEREWRAAKNRSLFPFMSARAAAASMLEEWLAGQDWRRFFLVGFSVCFHQFFASLAAARLLRERFPGLPIVFGGSSCTPGMGEWLARHFGIEHTVTGEGETALLALCRRVLREDAPTASSRQLSSLSEVPPPDFTDFFGEMGETFPHAPFIPTLPVEFSRGCWWGKCTFCNLNLQWQGYRPKPAERMVAEVEELRRRHATLSFSFTDNALPPKAAESFFRAMAASGKDYRFFAELRPEQYKILGLARGAGVTEIQVGIESFSNSLLSRMHKGVTVLDNLRVMREAVRTGVRLTGNLITEFPGSTEAEVEETLTTLDFAWPYPPLASATFFLGQGSPVDREPGRYGIRGAGPHPFYRELLPAALLPDFPSLLKGWSGDRGLQRKQWRRVTEKIVRWQAFHARRGGEERGLPALSLQDGGDFLLIRQERESGEPLHHRLRGASRAIYLACDDGPDLAELAGRFPGFPSGKLRTFLDDLSAKRLVFRQRNRYLSLAVRPA